VLVALASALIGAVFLKRKETTLAPAQVPAPG
jgi:hypothetical protein